MSDDAPPMVLALVRDLLFATKISATARALGTPVRVIREPAELSGQPGRLLLVDLNLPGSIAAAAEWGNAPARPVVGFVSHTDAATVSAARGAGIGRVMARSQFVQVLPDLLKTSGERL